jgi:predicted DNA-binding transcriptional regulator
MAFILLFSQYKFLNFRGVKLSKRDIIWDVHLPLKVKLFFWLVLYDRILIKLNLQVRGWRGSILCKCCGSHTEIIFHMFFYCSHFCEAFTL